MKLPQAGLPVNWKSLENFGLHPLRTWAARAAGVARKCQVTGANHLDPLIPTAGSHRNGCSRVPDVRPEFNDLWSDEIDLPEFRL